jgi:SNF2 family DNA or RNA helicase
MHLWEGKAKAHQVTGARLLGRAAVLGDGTGLGKTLTSLMWLAKHGAKRIIYAAPLEITGNLLTEIPKWVVTPIFDLRSLQRFQRGVMFDLIGKFDQYVVLVNLESWRQDESLIESLIDLQPEAVVVDEAHHLNNVRGKAYKGIREIRLAINQCPKPGCGALLKPVYTCRWHDCLKYETRFRFRYCTGCGHAATKVLIPPCPQCGTSDAASKPNEARSVKCFLGMTATNVVNQAMDAFALLNLADHGRFRNLKEFRQTYLTEGGWNRDQLARDIAPYYLARSREDAGVEMPPQSVQIREREFDTERYSDQWKAYQRLETEFRLELASGVLGITETITQITRLRQMLVWPAGIEIRDPKTKAVTDRVDIHQSFKLDWMEELAQERLEEGQRILVYSYFRAPLEELQRRLGPQAVTYTGATPRGLRDAIKADFGPKSKVRGYRPEWRAVLATYRSAGEGLELVGATRTLDLDEEWSPARQRQAHGRTQRMSQTSPTGVDVLRVIKSIDEWMARLNARKQEMTDGWNDAAAIARGLLEIMGNQG